MTAVFNAPEHRGKGIAKLLVLGAMGYVTEMSASKASRLRIMIKPTNALVKTMYSRLGFVDAGKMTLAEAYNANMETDMFPVDGGASNPGKYHSRMGLIMEKITPSVL